MYPRLSSNSLCWQGWPWFSDFPVSFRVLELQVYNIILSWCGWCWGWNPGLHQPLPLTKVSFLSAIYWVQELMKYLKQINFLLLKCLNSAMTYQVIVAALWTNCEVICRNTKYSEMFMKSLEWWNIFHYIYFKKKSKIQ